MQWFSKPDTERIPLPGGEWIEVRKQLSKGERDKVNAMLIKEIRQDGRMTPDFEMMSKAEVLGYLVNWSLTDDGQPIEIDPEVDSPKKIAAINNMTDEGFEAISEAVKSHVEAMERQRPTKKATRGGKRSSVTSASAA